MSEGLREIRGSWGWTAVQASAALVMWLLVLFWDSVPLWVFFSLFVVAFVTPPPAVFLKDPDFLSPPPRQEGAV